MGKRKNEVDWLSLNHGDDVRLTVTAADQRNAIRGSASNCAIVQSVYRSNPTIREVTVKEGDVIIRMPDENGVDYRARLIHSNESRGFAIRYDENGATDNDIAITLRMDKWSEVRKRGPRNPRAGSMTTVIDLEEGGDPENEGADTPPTTPEAPPAAAEAPPTAPTTPPLPPEATTPLRSPAVRRSRWDRSYFRAPPKGEVVA